jgi:hypothetical protein
MKDKKLHPDQFESFILIDVIISACEMPSIGFFLSSFLFMITQAVELACNRIVFSPLIQSTCSSPTCLFEK